MTAIHEILKPKSKEEMKDQILKMDLYHFLDVFRNKSFKDIIRMDIGFKKKFYFFFAFVFLKNFNKWYWPFWSSWFIATIFSDILMPLGSLWVRGTIDVIDDVGLFVIYLIWIPMLISMITMKRLSKRRSYDQIRLLEEIAEDLHNLAANALQGQEEIERRERADPQRQAGNFQENST